MAIDHVLKLYSETIQSPYLHYGFWDDPKTIDTNLLSIEDIVNAQGRYIEHLASFIPEDVKNIIDVGCGVGGNAAYLKEKGYLIDVLSPDAYQEEFIKNTYDNKNIIIHDDDIFEVDKTHISDVDLFFYDALKDEETISKTIEYFYECFSDTCILIFDDANWDGIILGTNEGIEKMNATVLYRKLIKNKIEDPSQWWNGLYMVVIKK